MAGLLCALLFGWSLVVGFKTLLQRLASRLGRVMVGDWSNDDRQCLSKAADTYSPASIDMLTDEMEASLASERASAAELVSQLSDRHALLNDADKQVASWDDKARAAIDKGRDDLARAALAERQRASLRGEDLRAEIARLNDLLRGYQVDIRSLQNRLGDVYRRRASAASRIDRAQQGARTRELLGDKWEEALPELESLDREADLAEARLEAMSLGAPRSFGRRIAQAEPDLALAPPCAPLDPRIERELAEMKARVAAQSSLPAPGATASGS